MSACQVTTSPRRDLAIAVSSQRHLHLHAERRAADREPLARSKRAVYRGLQVPTQPSQVAALGEALELALDESGQGAIVSLVKLGPKGR